MHLLPESSYNYISCKDMEQATRRINQLRVDKQPSQSFEGQEISISKPVTRSHSARVEALGKKATPTTLTSRNKSCRHPTTHPDHQIINGSSSSKPLNKSQVWDCGSSLYDSFELNSLNLQLDLAIKGSSIRTLSMPHLPEPYAPNLLSALAKHQTVPKKSSKVSKSLNKILRSVFSSSRTVNKTDTTTIPSPYTKVKTSSERQKGSSVYVYDGSKSMRVLSTIPEIQEIDDGHPKFSPDATPAVRRIVSERFTAPSLRVSCP